MKSIVPARNIIKRSGNNYFNIVSMKHKRFNSIFLLKPYKIRNSKKRIKSLNDVCKNVNDFASNNTNNKIMYSPNPKRRKQAYYKMGKIR